MSDFWDFIEAKMGCNVPKYVKNIFYLNGYENAVSIKTLKSADIVELQTFAQNTMESRIPEDVDKSDYYGCFTMNTKEFMFLPGHIRLIEEIVAYINQKTALHGPEFFASKPNIDRKRTVSKASIANSKGKSIKYFYETIVESLTEQILQFRE